MPFTSLKAPSVPRQALIFLTVSIFFSQTARGEIIGCDDVLRAPASPPPVRIEAFAVRIADLELAAPEVLYIPPAPNESDEARLQRVLGTTNLRPKGAGKNRRVFAWTSADGRPMVAKIYRRDGGPKNIAAKMQRELLVEQYLQKIGVRSAPVLKSLPEGIVIQPDVGLVVSEYLHADSSRRAKIQPQLSQLGSQFFHSPIREFESFLRTKYPTQGHQDVDRTLENIGITIADDAGVELQMIDW